MEDWIDSQIDGRVAAGFDARIARADARSSPPVNAAGEVASELGIAANWRMNAALTTKPEWAAEYAALARDHISNARAIREASTGASSSTMEDRVGKEHETAFRVRANRDAYRDAPPVNAAARAAERLELAGENRRAAADPGYRLVSAGLKETARDHISSVRSNRLARVAQAKTEAAHARHDLKEAMPALDAVVADNRAGKADWQPGYKQTGILKLGSEPQAPDAQPAAGNGLTDSWIDRALAAATHWPVVGAMADRALERRAIQEMADQQYDEYLRRRPQERSYEGLSAFGPQAAVAAKQRDETASTGAQTMDPSTAKAEVAHAKHDLKEARREDIWQQAIEIGRQAQTAGEQRRQEKTETASPRMAP